MTAFAPLAQLVEHTLHTGGVAGSSPAGCTKTSSQVLLLKKAVQHRDKVEDAVREGDQPQVGILVVHIGEADPRNKRQGQRDKRLAVDDVEKGKQQRVDDNNRDDRGVELAQLGHQEAAVEKLLRKADRDKEKEQARVVCPPWRRLFAKDMCKNEQQTNTHESKNSIWERESADIIAAHAQTTPRTFLSKDDD